MIIVDKTVPMPPPLPPKRDSASLAALFQAISCPRQATFREELREKGYRDFTSSKRDCSLSIEDFGLMLMKAEKIIDLP